MICRRARLAAWFATAAGLLLPACSPPAPPKADPVESAIRVSGPATASPSRGAGRRLFTTYCAPCHGEEGRGDGQNASRLAPRPPDLAAAAARLSPADLRRLVEGGTLSVGRTPLCPPYGRTLGAEAVEAVVTFVGTLGRRL
jgi:mono/diheme cytochrome c family protein